METKNLTAVITGATCGIGRSFAYKLAEKGYDLILTGRRRSELQKVAEDIVKTFRIKVEIIIGDLTCAKCRSEIRAKIKSTPTIDVLINNAGFGNDRPFYNTGMKDLRAMIITHDLAAIEFIHAVLPGMMRNRRGTIINVSSLGAFIPGFTRTLYLATKSFLHHFSKALSMEVHPYGIKVQSLCPGMTSTEFHKRASKNNFSGKLNALNFMSPDKVVEISMKSLKRSRVVCIPGCLNILIVLIAKALPGMVLRFLSKFRNEQPDKMFPKNLSDLGIAGN